MEIFQSATLVLAEQLPLLLVGSVKALVILVLTALLAFFLRRQSAALRHWVWSLGLTGALLIPVLTVLVPTWTVPVAPFPSQEAPTEVATPMHETVKVSDDAVATVTPPVDDAPATPPAPEQAAAPQEADVPPAPAAPETEERGAVTENEAGMGWPAMLLAIWLGGSVLVALYFIAGSLRARWLTRHGRVVEDPVWTGMLRDVCQVLGTDRRVQLVWSDRASMPFTWGITKPVIVLPAAASSWTMERRRVVLLHEGAHIKRWDCMTQAIAQVVCALHWFNPLVWWAAKQLRIERERATDDYVLATGARPSTYAEHLLDLARSLGATPGTPFGAVSMAKPSQLEGRLLSILRDETGNRMLSRTGASLSGLAFVALLLPLAAMQPVPHSTSETSAVFTDEVHQTLAEHALDSRTAATAEDAEDVEARVEEEAPLVEADPLAADDPIERTFHVAQGGQLHLDTDRGSITTRTGSSDRVHVEIRIDGHDAADVDWFDVEFEQRDHDVHVTASVDNGRDGAFSWLFGRSSPNIRFVVTVPPRYNLDLNTAGGSITVDDIEGTVAVRTSGGSLQLGQIDGPVTARTSGGSIRVDGSTADVHAQTSGGSITLGPIQGEAEARTSGGSINLAGVAGTVNARTSGGSVTARITEQPRGDSELRTSGGTVTVYIADGIGLDLDARTTAGRVTSDLSLDTEEDRSRSRLRGTIGGGGPLLTARTSAGSVRILPLDASANTESFDGAHRLDFEPDHFHQEFELDWLDEVLADVERAMEESLADIERDVELALSEIDVKPFVHLAQNVATNSLLKALDDLDLHMDTIKAWTEGGVALALADMLEEMAYKQETVMVSYNGEMKEVPIVELLAELPDEAGHPALSRLAERHPDADMRRDANEALRSAQ